MANHPNRSGNSKARNPKPAEIKQARIAAGLSEAAAAALIYTNAGKWQQWEAEEGTPEHQRMHPAFWDLFRIKVEGREIEEYP